MQSFWIGMILCVVCTHVTVGAEPLTPQAQRALKVAQEAFTPVWAPCGDTVSTQVFPHGGSASFGFHQMAPVVWQVEEVSPMSSDGKGGKKRCTR